MNRQFDKIEYKWRFGRVMSNLRGMRNKGDTGNVWLDEAWFTLVAEGEDFSQVSSYVEQIEEIIRLAPRHSIQKQTKLRYSQNVKEVIKHIESNPHTYIWAFPRILDVMKLLNWKNNSSYVAYNSPQNTFEKQVHELFKSFPFHRDDRVECIVFAGAAVLEDSRFTPTAGAGSVVTEIGFQNIPSHHWHRYSVLGFQYGLYLVQVKKDEPTFRLHEAYIHQLIDEAKKKTGKGYNLENLKWIDDRDFEANAEKSLPKLVKRIHGGEIGKAKG